MPSSSHSSSSPLLFEICCFNKASALLAIDEGIDRVELCRERGLDGVTPAEADVKAVWAHIQQQQQQQEEEEDGKNDWQMQMGKATPKRRRSNNKTQLQVMLRSDKLHTLSDTPDNQCCDSRQQHLEPSLLHAASAFFAAPFVRTPSSPLPPSSPSSPPRDHTHPIASHHHHSSPSSSSSSAHHVTQQCPAQRGETIDSISKDASAFWSACDGFVLGYLTVRVEKQKETEEEQHKGDANQNQHHPRFPLTEDVLAYLCGDDTSQQGNKKAKDVSAEGDSTSPLPYCDGGQQPKQHYWWIDVDWELLDAFFTRVCGLEASGAGQQQHFHGEREKGEKEEACRVNNKSLTFHRAIDVLFRQEELYQEMKMKMKRTTTDKKKKEEGQREGERYPSSLGTTVEEEEEGEDISSIAQFPHVTAAIRRLSAMRSVSASSFGNFSFGFDRILTSGGPPKALGKPSSSCSAPRTNDAAALLKIERRGVDNIKTIVNQLSLELRNGEQQKEQGGQQQNRWSSFCSVSHPFAIMIGGGVSEVTAPLIMESLLASGSGGYDPRKRKVMAANDDDYLLGADEEGDNNEGHRTQPPIVLMDPTAVIRIELHGSLLPSAEADVPTSASLRSAKRYASLL